MTEDLRQAVKQFILDTFLPGEDPNQLTYDLPLISRGILDSIATLKLIMHLEDHYGITLAAHEADKEHLDTIDQIAGLIAKKKG